MSSREPGWPGLAWVEAGDGRSPYEIGQGILRAGRDDDNEICLPNATVHRYHALIHRDDDAGILIRDISGAGGSGISVNGRTVAGARLRDGDTVVLGTATFRVFERPY